MLRHRGAYSSGPIDSTERGFGLVEIMVGLVVGMIAMLVMVQMLTSSEVQKRTTLGVDDAQSNAAIALDQLQREVRQSGFGINQLRLLGCRLHLETAGGIDLPLSMVTINPGAAVIPAGDANSDTLLVMYSNSSGATQGQDVYRLADREGDTNNVTRLLAGNSDPDNPVQETYYTWADQSFNVGDWFIPDPRETVDPRVACPAVMQMRRVLGKPADTVAASPPGTINSGLLFNLGPSAAGGVASLRVQAFAVRNGKLAMCDYIANNCGTPCVAADGSCSPAWVPIANNIVAMRLLYGRDTAVGDLDGMVDTYDAWTPPAAGTTGCDLARIISLRVALVAQSAESSTDVVTAAAPVWAGSGVAPINLAAVRVRDGQSWQNYRYKLFETVIPLRNSPAWMLVRLREQGVADSREPTGCAS